MSLRKMLFFIGCIVAWVFVLPLFALIVLTSLVAYAALSELGELLLGGGEPPLDNSTARKIAHRLSLGG
jgi:hypothetical protein